MYILLLAWLRRGTGGSTWQVPVQIEGAEVLEPRKITCNTSETNASRALATHSMSLHLRRDLLVGVDRDNHPNVDERLVRNLLPKKRLEESSILERRDVCLQEDYLPKARSL